MKRFFAKLVATLMVVSAALLASCVKAPELTLIGATTVDLSADGSPEIISFIANRDWMATSSASWVKISPASGTADKNGYYITITIWCDPNTDYEDRTAEVTIKMDGMSQAVTVRQLENPGIVLSSQLYDLPSDAQTLDIEVKSNIDYTVTISDKWIKQTITKVLSSKTYSFSIEENNTHDARSAIITLKPLDAAVQEQIIAVKQAQKDALIIKDKSFDMPYGGGEIEFKVEANVAFEVKPSVDWIEYVETKALSTSTTRLKVAENATYETREGSVEIKQRGGSLSHALTIRQMGRIAVTSIELDKTTLQLREGETAIIAATVKPGDATDKAVTWTSSDPQIATVDETGKVTAVKEGCARITVEAGEKKATCAVTIKAAMYNTLLQAVSDNNYGPFWLGSQKVVAKVTSYDLNLGAGNSFNPEKLVSQFEYLGLSESLPLAKDGWIQQIWIGGKQATILYMGRFIYAKTLGSVVYRVPFSREEIVNEENSEIESIAIEFEPSMSLESVFETNDGNFIAQCVNMNQSSEDYKTRYLYKVKVDDELNAETKFLFKCVESTINACGVREHWSFKQYGSRILISPYGGGRTGQLWLSEDYGDSFCCIFNIANTKTYVATKPNGALGYGALGIHPLPNQMVPPQKEDFWDSVSKIGNGNRHIHSCCYDEVFDRIWLVMGDDKFQATGIYWTDDFGRTWHRKSLYFDYSEIDKGPSTQFLQVVSLNNCVLFGTDGWGNGIYRYNRGNKEEEPEIEYVFGWSENKTGLEGVANHTIVTDDGVVLMTFAPDSKKAAPTGGIVATDGYHFRKVFLDTYNNNTLETMKIGWTTFLHINGHDLYIRTKDKKELIVVENFI